MGYIWWKKEKNMQQLPNGNASWGTGSERMPKKSLKFSAANSVTNTMSPQHAKYDPKLKEYAVKFYLNNKNK